MGAPRRVTASAYMEWAKTRPPLPFDLASSGVLPLTLAELGAGLEDLELSGPSLYGYEPLERALAGKCGVPPECVVAAVGTSLANHLAMAALLAPGDRVLLEHPGYEPIAALARYLGAEVVEVPRRFERGFRLDPGDVEARLTRRTRLIVLTHLHNPSGAPTDEATLAELGRLARGVGARVLVDEVYLEMAWVEGAREARPGGAPGPRPPLRSAFHLGPEFVVTSSLTKAYGLNGLRCGWILAEPELARRIWRLSDLFAVIPAHPAERLSVVALARLEAIADRAAALLAANRALLARFLASRPDLEVVLPEFGTVLFPRLAHGSVDALAALLQERYETAVVPGRFFGMPEHFRLGIGGPREAFAAGLERLGAALDELGRVA